MNFNLYAHAGRPCASAILRDERPLSLKQSVMKNVLFPRKDSLRTMRRRRPISKLVPYRSFPYRNRRHTGD